MAENEVEGAIPTFKRRKVMRKPNYEDDSNGAPTLTNNAGEHEEDEPGLVTRVQRKGGTKKLGIGFSSMESSRNIREEQPEEQALVVAIDGVAELPQNDRFVKPTGRVGVVTEDKHMIAYVDSKLAETRAAAASSISPIEENRTHVSTRVADGSESPQAAPISVTTTQAVKSKPGDTTYQIAQERSRRVYQRPTKRKSRPSRPETDVARDSMIDQIMGENQVPHYDKTLRQTRDEDNEGEDREAAAEEAFKAQMLADLERNAKRRPPRISQATTSTGPKLGGSRAQREKMRALEEAKASGPGSGSKK